MVAACPFPYPRGTPVRIFGMANALSNRGHEVHVLTYHLGDQNTTTNFKIHRIPPINTYHKYSPGPSYQKLMVVDSILAIKLFKFLKFHHIDLIHAHHYEGLIISSLIRKFINHRLIYDAHTILESELPFYEIGFSKGLKKIVGSRLDRWLPRRADHIIAATGRIRDKLIENSGLSPDSITVVTNGVERDHFNVRPQDSVISPDGKKTLIFTGNLAPYQGVDLLLRSFREILNIRRDVRLLIISDSSFDDYEPLANTLKIRNYIEVISSNFLSLPKYLAGADVALNPRTDCDGIPQKILNYMAAGKPIVSFDGSAVNMVHGRTGWIVENGNIPAFAKAIFHLLENPELAKELGDNAKNFVASEFSWEKSADKAEAVYEQLIYDHKKDGKLKSAVL